MESARRASGYDLFKLMVVVLLLILFFIFNRGTTAPSLAPISTLQPDSSAAPTTTEQTASPASALTSISPTLTYVPIPSPTATIPTNTPLPSPTPTAVAQLTDTPLPAQIATPLSSPTSTPSASTPAVSACESASSRSRLQTGMKAVILRRLNFRSSAGIGDNWLLTNQPGTRVEVVGGPECQPHRTGAYVWWQIKLPDGQIGWSAEAPQFGSFYFMEPSP